MIHLSDASSSSRRKYNMPKAVPCSGGQVHDRQAHGQQEEAGEEVHGRDQLQHVRARGDHHGQALREAGKGGRQEAKMRIFL